MLVEKETSVEGKQLSVHLALLYLNKETENRTASQLLVTKKPAATPRKQKKSHLLGRFPVGKFTLRSNSDCWLVQFDERKRRHRTQNKVCAVEHVF